MRRDVHQQIIYGRQLVREQTGELTGGVAHALQRFGVDQIGDGFRFGQVELAVQKGAFGEFSGFSLPGARFDAERQHAVQKAQSAVTLQFDAVFPCIAVRRRKNKRERLVQEAAVRIQNPAVMSAARSQRRKKRRIGMHTRQKDPVGNGACTGAGKADNADGAGCGRRGDCRNGIGHGCTCFLVA